MADERLELQFTADDQLSPTARRIQTNVTGDFARMERGPERFNRAMRAPTQSLQNFRRIVIGVGAALVAAFSIGVVARQINSVQNELHQLQIQAARTGQSIENVSRLQFISDRANVDITTTTQALFRMQAELSNNEEKWQELGIATRDASGELLSGIDLLAAVSSRLGEAETAAEQAGIAYDLLGRQASRLMPLLVEDIGALADESDRLGATVEARFAAMGEAVADQRHRFRAVVSGVQRDIIVQFLPSIAAFTGTVAEVFAENRDLIIESATGIISSIRSVVEAAGFGSEETMDALAGIPAGILTIEAGVGRLSFVVGSFVRVVRGTTRVVSGIVAALYQDIRVITAELRVFILQQILELEESFIETVQRATILIPDAFREAGSAAQEFIDRVVGMGMPRDPLGLEEAATASARGFGATERALRGARQELEELQVAGGGFANTTQLIADIWQEEITEGVFERSREAFAALTQQLASIDFRREQLDEFSERAERARDTFDDILASILEIPRGMGEAGRGIREALEEAAGEVDDEDAPLTRMRSDLEIVAVMIEERLPNAMGEMAQASIAMAQGMQMAFNTMTRAATNQVEMMLRGEQNIRGALQGMARSFVNMLIQMAAQLLVFLPLALLFNVLTGGALGLAGVANTAAVLSQTGGLMTMMANMGRAQHGQTSAPPPVGFAQGGIVRRPTLAVVGESGPEMIVPLRRPGQAQGTEPLPSGHDEMGGAPVVVETNFTISAIDGEGTRRWLESGGAEAIEGTIISALSRSSQMRSAVRGVS